MFASVCPEGNPSALHAPRTFPPHTRVFSVTEYLFTEHYWQTMLMLSVDSEVPPPLPLVGGDGLRAGERPSQSLPKQEGSEGRLTERSQSAAMGFPTHTLVGACERTRQTPEPNTEGEGQPDCSQVQGVREGL